MFKCDDVVSIKDSTLCGVIITTKIIFGNEIYEIDLGGNISLWRNADQLERI